MRRIPKFRRSCDWHCKQWDASLGNVKSIALSRREKVKHEGERRSIFMRYLGEVATAVSNVNGMNRQELYDALVSSAKRILDFVKAKIRDG